MCDVSSWFSPAPSLTWRFIFWNALYSKHITSYLELLHMKRLVSLIGLWIRYVFDNNICAIIFRSSDTVWNLGRQKIKLVAWSAFWCRVEQLYENRWYLSGTYSDPNLGDNQNLCWKGVLKSTGVADQRSCEDQGWHFDVLSNFLCVK